MVRRLESGSYEIGISLAWAPVIPSKAIARTIAKIILIILTSTYSINHLRIRCTAMYSTDLLLLFLQLLIEHSVLTIQS